MELRNLLSIFIFTITIQNSIKWAKGEKILFLVPISTRSETHFYEPLVTELARLGHEVTYVTSAKRENPPLENVKEIVPIPSYELASSISNYSALSSGIKLEMEMLFLDMSYFAEKCDFIHENKEFKDLFNKGQKYDLIFTNFLFAPCFYGIIYKNGGPFILLSSFPVANYLMHDLGSYNPTSFVPIPVIYCSNYMTFMERTFNFVVDLVQTYSNYFTDVPLFEQVYRKHLGQDLPSASEIARNVSLVMQNTHFTSTYHRTTMPDFIDIGGIHCKPPRKLPDDLEKIVSNASDGFIYFSLGSIVKSSTLPNSTIQVLVDVFSSLKQTVIWKWDVEPLKNLPKNIIQRKWLPQQDLLGHKNIRLFISHSGLLSTQQTIFHGVPTIVFPVYFDQITNAKMAVNQGISIQLDLSNLSREEFKGAINRILTEPGFSKNMKILSKVFREDLTTPLERAVHWTNFVLKHKGAPHLRSSARNLNFMQFHSIDVIAFLLFITVILITFVFYIIKMFFKCCMRAVEHNTIKIKQQ